MMAARLFQDRSRISPDLTPLSSPRKTDLKPVAVMDLKRMQNPLSLNVKVPSVTM